KHSRGTARMSHYFRRAPGAAPRASCRAGAVSLFEAVHPHLAGARPDGEGIAIGVDREVRHEGADEAAVVADPLGRGPPAVHGVAIGPDAVAAVDRHAEVELEPGRERIAARVERDLR